MPPVDEIIQRLNTVLLDLLPHFHHFIPLSLKSEPVRDASQQ
jgi:hypothetical protein